MNQQHESNRQDPDPAGISRDTSTHEDRPATEPVVVTPALLRDWPLPGTGSGKDARGRLLVIGGSRRVPGAAQLAGLAAMRVGAGVLTMAVAESVAVGVATTTPEAGVVGLPETSTGSVTGDGLDVLADVLADVDAVLIGPGLDTPDGTENLLRQVLPLLPEQIPVVLDAFALGVLPGLAEVVRALAGRLVLTPNLEEAGRLLGSSVDNDELADHVLQIAEKYSAVVCCHQWIATADGRLWQGSSGHGGLGTSGSGDVMAGAITGLLARGADAAQAACWGAHLHSTAGDRLALEIGPVGFLASDLVRRLPGVLAELGAR